MTKISKFRKFISNSLNPSDLYEALRPLVLMLFISGIPPYELNPSAKTNLSKCVIVGRFIGVLYMAIFITSFAMTIGDLTIVTSFFMAYGLSQVVDVILMTSTLFAMVLIYLSAFFKKYHFDDVVNILAKVDTRLTKIAIDLSHRKTILTFVKYISLTAVVYCLYILGSYLLLNGSLDSPFTWISYFVPHFIIAQTIVKYLTTTKIIRHRFATLNKVSCRYCKNILKYFKL